jgi:uncharacterized membrane protein YidH (DUF202 family)
VQLPADLVVAGMGRRVGAWCLDSLFVGLVNLILYAVAFIVGAISLNQRAFDQIEWGTRSPLANVTAPWINVQMGPMVVVLVVTLAISLA